MTDKNWEKTKTHYLSVVDSLDCPIDDKIIDVVVGLSILGIHTTASCEGHLDHGAAGPWVDVEADIDNNEIENQLEEIQTKIESCKSIDCGRRHEELYEQYHSLLSKLRHPNLKVQAKVIELLAKFYQNRNVSYDVQLHVSEIYGDGGSRIENQGVNIQEVRSKTEQKERLAAYQQEMDCFAVFLRKMAST